MKILTIFFLVMLIGSFSLLIYSNYASLSPLDYVSEPKKNVEFSLSIDEDDNLIFEDSIHVDYSYRVIDWSLGDFVQFPRVMSIGETVNSLEFTSTLEDVTTGETYQTHVNVGDFSLFRDNYLIEFNQVVPLGNYEHRIDFEYKVDSKFRVKEIVNEVIVHE